MKPADGSATMQLSGSGRFVSATNSAYSSRVTSYLAIASLYPIVTTCCGTECPRSRSGSSGDSSPAGAPIVNVPCGTTTISGQPFEQSRNDVPGAGVCARAGGKVVIPSTAKPATPTIALHTDLFMCTSSLDDEVDLDTGAKRQRGHCDRRTGGKG